ncbi:hypothetical protein QWJ07_23515 [Frankia sp. RB7]|nr:hypothetical protein [Frankia sp. RB7]
MIVRLYSYRGSRAASLRLDRHLWKQEGQQPEFFAVRNLYVHHSVEGFEVMAALKAGSPKASIAYWQIIVSPTKTLRLSERRRVIDLIVQELNAADNPLMAFSHNKKIRARAGGGGNHLHVILGHISPISLRALDMRQVLPRLHKVMVLAAYEIGAVAPLTPYRDSIVEALTAEGSPHAARWLSEAPGNARVRRPARMRDSMRRSAQSAGFDLASFQARLERLWSSGAGESEVTSFLEQNGVDVRAGTAEGVTAFYHGKTFVGALHRIVGRDAAVVRKELEDRAPALLRLKTDPLASVRKNPPRASQDDRSFTLRRQRKTDYLEHGLATLRIQRQRLVYEENTGPGSTTGELPTASELAGSARMECVLETAVKLLWEDDRWVERPVEDLVRFVTSVKPAGAPVDSESEECKSEAELPEDRDSPPTAGFGPG